MQKRIWSDFIGYRTMAVIPTHSLVEKKKKGIDDFNWASTPVLLRIFVSFLIYQVLWK